MKKRILIIVYVLLLCGTATFAWLSNAQNSINETIDVDFSGGKAVVTDFSFNAYLERKIADGEVNASDKDNDGYVAVDEGAFSFDTQSTLPGTRLPFRIRIQNLGDAKKSTKLVLDMYIEGYDPDSNDEMIRSKADLLDVIYIEIVLGDGFSTNDALDPDEDQIEDADKKVETRHVFKKLSEAIYKGDGLFSLEIYSEEDKIVIPTVDEVNESLAKNEKTQNGYVALNCSFYYDQNAGAEYQGKGIDALSFRLEQ